MRLMLGIICLSLWASLTPAHAQPVDIEQDEKYAPGDGQAGDWFGSAVAAGTGNRLLIGAIYDNEMGEDAGSAYLFDSVRDEQLLKLVGSDSGPGDRFGQTVAINESVICVGSRYHDGIGQDSGAVYLFDRESGLELAKLEPDDLIGGDRFGTDIAIDGDLLVIGASEHDTDGISRAGAVYVYDISTPGSPELMNKLVAEDRAISDLFGFSVDIHNGLIGIGALYHEPGSSFCNTGAAYIFDAFSGEQLSRIIPDDLECEDIFGWDIAISREVLLVSAIDHEHTRFQRGAVYGYSILTPEAPHQLYEIQGVTGAFGSVDNGFGWSLAVDGPHGVIGQTQYSGDGAGANSGAAFVINLFTGELEYKLEPNNPDFGDQAGQSVDVLNGRVFTGAVGDDTHGESSGAAYMFRVPTPGPCSFADRTIPYGVIDTTDANAFYYEFFLRRPEVDIAHPIGELDYFDFALMLELYRRGCDG